MTTEPATAQGRHEPELAGQTVVVIGGGTELTDVRAMIETHPLEKAAEACPRMMSGTRRCSVSS